MSGGTQPGAIIARLRLIGQMEAWTLTSESILPTGRKTRALLAIIALSAPRPVLRGRVAEMLWSRRPEEQARASLRQEIHRLLEATDPVGSQILTITRDHLSLRPGTVWIDVDEVLRATPARPAALGLFDGELLEDLQDVDPAFDAWLASERERLRDRARALGDVLLRDQTEPEEMIQAAQQLLAIDRSHEGAWRALMRAHAARGERGMAIQAYERCRAVLNELLDAQPSQETQRLLAELKDNPQALRSAVPSVPIVASIAPAASAAAREPAPAAMPALRPATPPRPMPRVALRAAEEQQELAPTARTSQEHGSEARARGGARVGVLPLTLIGTTDAEAHLSTGLADEITAALARFRWMFLVASSSLARFATQTRDEGSLRRAFGLDMVIDGSVHRSGERLRVSLRLLDLRGGNQVVWSGRFDRNADDLLSLQDEIAAEVVAQIDPEILLIETQRAATRPLSDPTAYDLLLRAIPLTMRLERPVFMQAGELLDRAITLEPDYAAAHAWYAYWHMFLVGQGWAESADEGMVAASRLAERAISLDPHDAKALTIAGHVRSFLHNRLREAIALHERALQLNPNLAMAWNLSGIAHAYLGDHDEAERRVARYKQLSPLDPQAFFFDTARIVVALMRRRHAQAAEIGREVTEMNASFSASLKPYLAALGHLGEVREAEMVRARLLSLEPSFSLRRFEAASPFVREADRTHFFEGLRLAGVPE